MSWFKNLFSKKSNTKFPNVIVAKVLAVNPHPNADRLRLATVDTGNGQLEIVCGAPNLAVGQFVPLAMIGATLPNGLTISETAIRGVVSRGMLCAADELGLGEDHSGIIVLEEAVIGDPIDNYIKNIK